VNVDHARVTRRARDAMHAHEDRVVSELAAVGGGLRHFLG
jgi:hypothetical protein